MNTGQVGIDALGMCAGPETKARLLRSGGRNTRPAGRPCRASFSGPSPRTKAEGAAGTGPFVSGAPGAAALALLAAALLLAPGEARAGAECGAGNGLTLNCPVRDFTNGIVYGVAGDGNNLSGTGLTQTLNLLGSATRPITITAGALGVAFGGQKTGSNALVLNIGDATGGTAHVINIVQGTNSHTGADRNNGIYLWQSTNNPGARAEVHVRAGVTIGTMATPMKGHGIFLEPRASSTSMGRGSAGTTLTSAATIYAAKQGIRVYRTEGGTNDDTAITNTGAIYSGVGNPSATGGNYRDDRPHGILAFVGGTQLTGSLIVDNDGDITLGGAYTGILMNYWGAGAMSLDNSGNIGAVAGQTAKEGIRFNFDYWTNQSAQAVTLTNSGAITASDFGIRLKKLSGGAVELTNSGAITVTGDAAQHMGHAIYLAEGVTFGEGRTYAANSGDVTIDNSGALRSKNHALYAYRPTTTTGNVADDFELTNSGAITSEEGDGIRIERPGGTGDMTVDNSGAITAGVNAIWIDEILTPATTGTVSVTHSAGALSAGRSGIVVQVASSNTAATVTPRASSAPQPLIDVAWGSTASSGATARGTTGTAANDNGPLPGVGYERRAGADLRPGGGGQQGQRRRLWRPGRHRGLCHILARRGGAGGQGRRPGRVRGQHGATGGRAHRRHRRRQRLRRPVPGGAGERRDRSASAPHGHRHHRHHRGHRPDRRPDRDVSPGGQRRQADPAAEHPGAGPHGRGEGDPAGAGDGRRRGRRADRRGLHGRHLGRRRLLEPGEGAAGPLQRRRHPRQRAQRAPSPPRAATASAPTTRRPTTATAPST